MNERKINKRNIFIYGLSGSGKDTISNYLRDTYGYLKLRIAGTIKQYVFETYGFKNQEEFETKKRQNPEVRMAHNNFGKQYDQEGLDRSDREATTNRITAICNRTALEFEICSEMNEHPICIVDVRNYFEASMLLEKGFYGIFLNRRTDEYALKDHKTEQDMFMNGEIIKILKALENVENACFILNSSAIDLSQLVDINKAMTKACENDVKPFIVSTQGSIEILLNLVNNIVINNGNVELIKKYTQKFINEEFNPN